MCVFVFVVVIVVVVVVAAAASVVMFLLYLLWLLNLNLDINITKKTPQLTKQCFVLFFFFVLFYLSFMHNVISYRFSLVFFSCGGKETETWLKPKIRELRCKAPRRNEEKNHCLSIKQTRHGNIAFRGITRPIFNNEVF